MRLSLVVDETYFADWKGGNGYVGSEMVLSLRHEQCGG